MKEIESSTNVKELTPAQIVKELDKYIIGQQEAKKCVAIAIRNRWRRQQLSPELRDEVAPKNIIMIGATGIGKTEIARRLAHLVNAPFLKVEATKYTEIGYHGRDVESIVRDLVEISVNMVRQQHARRVDEIVKSAVEEKLVKALLHDFDTSFEMDENDETPVDFCVRRPRKKIVAPLPKSGKQKAILARLDKSRERIREQLRSGKMEKENVQITVEDHAIPMVEIFSNAAVDQLNMEFQNMFEKMVPGRKILKQMTVAEARQVLIQQEQEKLIDKDKVIREAVTWAENMGIIFIDEIDKIVGSEYKFGPDVSRQGVQRDLLPVVEGCSVVTRYGIVRSDHILFIAAGAFSSSKPSDLIPELQGRFPIRVELQPLTQKEFIAILKEPNNALTKQYQALLHTENVSLEFEPEAIEEIAKICEMVNHRMQNIGARRLYTIMEKLLEDISFKAPEMKDTKISITAQNVKDRLTDIVKDEDLSRYIL